MPEPDDDIQETISELDPAYTGPPSKAEAFAASAFPRGVRVDVAYRDALNLLPTVQRLDAQHGRVLAQRTKAEGAYRAAVERGDSPDKIKRLLDRFDDAERAVEESEVATSGLMRTHGYGSTIGYHRTLSAYSKVCLPADSGSSSQRPRAGAPSSNRPRKRRSSPAVPPTPAQRKSLVGWLTAKINANRERRASEKKAGSRGRDGSGAKSGSTAGR